MKTKRTTAMCETAMVENLDALKSKPLTEFADGSAAMACRAWDHEGFVWMSNGHFVLRAGRIANLPQNGKMPRPDAFVDVLAKVPPRSFAPRLVPADGVAFVGPAKVNLTYLQACAVGSGGVDRLEWRAAAALEPVYGLAGGEVVCVVMPLGGAE